MLIVSDSETFAKTHHFRSWAELSFMVSCYQGPPDHLRQWAQYDGTKAGLARICPTRVVNRRYDSFDVYIGRGKGSVWGNPFSHEPDSLALYQVATREESILQYEAWLPTQRHILERLPELRGLRLGCWCAPQDCHGRILVKLLWNLYGIV